MRRRAVSGCRRLPSRGSREAAQGGPARPSKHPGGAGFSIDVPGHDPSPPAESLEMGQRLAVTAAQVPDHGEDVVCPDPARVLDGTTDTAPIWPPPRRFPAE